MRALNLGLVGAVVATPMNVLLIGVDDLRPEIAGPYGQAYMHTPNILRLAQRSTTFTRAYCQVPLCSPSRTSLLTGLRPDTSKVWEIGPYFRTTSALGPATVTLPQHFRLHGYNTTGAGKVRHEPSTPPAQN
jgi:iduronate 2-sulfatase